MAPSALSSNQTHSTNGNGHLKDNNKPVHLTSTDVIHLEHEHGAHNYHPLPIVFESAKGAKVWDPEGKEYIDMLSAYSAVNQGHTHPRLIETLIAQSQKLTLSSRAFYNSSFAPFAQYITRMFGYDMVLPMNTGAEAVETGLKLARKWGYDTVKGKGIKDGEAIILSVEGNFHGRTLGVISMSTDPSSTTGFGPYLHGVGPIWNNPATGEQKLIRFGVIEDVEEALNAIGDKVAGFLIEPIQGEAGIVVPPEGYLAQVAALCKKHNVLLICDEIQTGLCRTGKMLACQWDNVRPDVVLLGKALSGGMYPVSAVLADRDVMLTIKPGEHGSTYGGNPLASALATTALQILIDEDLSARALRLGELFRSSVRDLKSPYIKEVRGRGLLNAVVMDDDCEVAGERYRGAIGDSNGDGGDGKRGRRGIGKKGRTAWQFCLLLKERGVLAKPTHVNIIRFAPPLVIEEQDLLTAVKIIEQTLKDLDELEEIPGDDAEERGHADEVTN